MTGCFNFALGVVLVGVAAMTIVAWPWLLLVYLLFPALMAAWMLVEQKQERDLDCRMRDRALSLAPRAPRRSTSAKLDLLRLTATEQAAFQELMNLHRATLLARRARLVTDDGYGNEDRTKWEQELQYFLDNVLLKDGRLSR